MACKKRKKSCGRKKKRCSRKRSGPPKCGPNSQLCGNSCIALKTNCGKTIVCKKTNAGLVPLANQVIPDAPSVSFSDWSTKRFGANPYINQRASEFQQLATNMNAEETEKLLREKAQMNWRGYGW